VRVQHEGVPVFTFSLLDRLDEADLVARRGME
jgi:hypothetical protein